MYVYYADGSLASFTEQIGHDLTPLVLCWRGGLLLLPPPPPLSIGLFINLFIDLSSLLICLGARAVRPCRNKQRSDRSPRHPRHPPGVRAGGCRALEPVDRQGEGASLIMVVVVMMMGDDDGGDDGNDDG